jgi:hypothetical protein
MKVHFGEFRGGSREISVAAESGSSEHQVEFKRYLVLCKNDDSHLACSGVAVQREFFGQK